MCPPQRCQASHIRCKYALVRGSSRAFSPDRSPQILISQVTVVGFKPVAAADITIQASQINLGTLSLHFSRNHSVMFASSFLYSFLPLTVLINFRNCTFVCFFCDSAHLSVTAFLVTVYYSVARANMLF